MLFNSLTFLYGFLPVTYGVFWTLRGRQSRYVWLTITGYAFYAFWDYRFCSVMALSTLSSYLAGRALEGTTSARARRFFLVAPITLDLGLLGFFKYANLTLSTSAGLARALHVPLIFPALSIVLPIGISFYTFHTITYIVDVYRGVVKPTRNFFEFTSYVSLFSQLVAGPIVRFRQIENDLENIGVVNRVSSLNVGWSFFCIGMIEKVLVADTIAAVINPALDKYQDLSTVGAWLCVLGYSYQLYFDFAGYSDMAVGLGHLFGLHIPQNFNSPYKALDISDFWRRWHISLSTCLRDYLYIPMGGNRVARWKVARNLLVTMLLGGLWHGANWTFVAWGGYHGLLLLAYRALATHWDKLPTLIRRIGTFLLVAIGWVFFRSTNFAMVLSLFHTMFVWTTGTQLVGVSGLVTVGVIAAVFAHKAPNSFQVSHDWRPIQIGAIAFLFLACLLILYSGGQSPFLYFQF